MFKYLVLCLLLVISSVSAEEYIHHELEVTIDPATNSLKVTDQIRLPSDRFNDDIYFILHGNLNVTAQTSGVNIQLIEDKIDHNMFMIPENNFKPPEEIPYKVYRISGVAINEISREFVLSYKGEINHPIKNISKEYARGFSETPGIISDQGIYLGGSTYWLPWFNDGLTTFNMTVIAPQDWRVVSQGKRASEEKSDKSYQIRWESPEPMDEVYLIAARFTEYQKKIGKVNVLAYLRTPDESMANKYLETTSQYLEMYRQLIGPYPYTKFALIENFWETGYGMPSFTLLGEKVIRFPFILHSSYPHELLHNWWGNSVFVDYDTGNWCEGLTVYLADHLIKEQRGQGVEYRRGSLQAYTDYVNEENEFPLREFLSRYDAPSSSIGYSKSMMIFNMLRQQVGDDIFVKAIQTFYRDNKFKRAGFQDIRHAFESVSGQNFESFFSQWIDRTGAPVIRIEDPKVEKKGDSYLIGFRLTQNQKGDPYHLKIPVAVYLEGEPEAKFEILSLDKNQDTYSLSYTKRPLGLDVDPQFDVFRRLDRNEIPPALSQVFGAEELTIVLPANESGDKLAAYQKLAESWSQSEREKITITTDEQLDNLPPNQAVWIFGGENKFKKTVVENLSGYDISIDQTAYRIGKSAVTSSKNSIILSTRHPQNPEYVITWLQADNAAAIPGLGRKLPHYSKYSYLAFEGEEPTNILKGQWPAVNSPMSTTFTYEDLKTEAISKGHLPKRPALAMLAPVFLEEQMLSHVKYLAGEKLQGRGIGSMELDQAADYIAAEFKKAGLRPGGDQKGYFQIWEERVGRNGQVKSLKNVIGILPGKKQEWADQSVVICAHYDHLGLGWPDVREGNEGKIHYGADDNASGVSILIELAKLLGESLVPDRTIIFIAFTAEESGLIGSKYYVKNYKKFPAQKIIGAINLDTVGRLGANKLLVLSNSSASEWKHIAMGIGFVTGIPYELVAQDLDASDQVSFIKAGIPAIQLFSGPHSDYHRPSDTVDKIDPAGMVKIATFTREAIVYLAERENPMTFTGSTQVAQKPAGPPGGKKVGTGVMPDFAFQGKGVKAGAVSPDSPAAKAGVQKGDVIIQLGEEKIVDLRGYSNALKSYKPGDTTTIVYIRDGKEIQNEITLQAR